MGYKLYKLGFLFFVIVMNFNLLTAQNKGVLEGKVVDAATNEPLIGAAIIIEGTNTGAVADLNGVYRLTNVPFGDAIITAKYLGYESLSKHVNLTTSDKQDLDFELNLIGILNEEIVITAQAEGQISAINKQLSSNTIENVISAKKIQEVPDANAAESLGRLPGVSILRNGGEGSKIVIRGLAPKFNKVQVEGVKMASTDSDDRSTDLSMISPYMLEAIEVSKAAMADKEADVLGGSVNFVLREAPKETKFDVLLQGGYNKLFNNYKNYKLVIGGSKRFFNDKLGIFAQVDLERRNRSSYEMKATYNNVLLSNPGPLDTIDVSLTNLYIQQISRDIKRGGGALVLDYKLKNGSVKLSSFGSLINKNIVNRYEDMRPTYLQQYYGLNNSVQDIKVMTNSLSINKSYGPLKISGGLSYSYSDNYSPDNVIFSGIEANAFETPLDLEAGPSYVASKAKYNIDNAIVSEISKDSFYTYESEFALNLNLEYEHSFSKNLNMKLKTGYKHKILNKFYDREYNKIPVSWAGHGAAFREKILETYPWMLDYTSPTSSNLPYSLFADDNYTDGVFPGGDYQVKYAPQIDLTNEILNISEDYYFKDYILSNKDDYEGTETYDAAYIMGTFNIGKKLTFIPGMRYENNTTEYTANRGNSSFMLWNEGYAFSDTTVKQTHNYLLPMIHLKYKPLSWLDIRLAYTHTLARPDFSDIIPKWNIEDFAVEWNNPYLKPSLSHNYDVYLSIFQNKMGLLTLGVFTKRYII
ncbi:MAG: carboxypeptidase-like regulatory domain-containing protein [Saprospiraceae bacterium]